MADIKVSEMSSTESPWSQWAISTSGKHHLTRPGYDRTRCNAAIEPGWVRLTRTEILPPPTSSPKEKREKSMCRGCRRKGGL